MLGWASSCNNPLPYLWLFPLAGSLDGESLNQRAWTSLSFFEHFAKLLPWGLLSFGSTWWKMSLIAEDRQGQAREKEHSKHSSRKRHSRVTEAAALVICCPDMKALLVALPFLESHFWILPYKANSALDMLVFFFCSLSTPSSLLPQGLCICYVPLLGMFSLKIVTTGAFLFISVQISNAQRGHLSWPALKKSNSNSFQPL